MKLNKILETALYVNNLEEAEEFYVGILGLEIVKRSQSVPPRDLFYAAVIQCCFFLI